MPATNLILPWLPNSTTISTPITSILNSPTPPSHSDRVLLAHHYGQLAASYHNLSHRGQPLKLLLPCPSNPQITTAQFIVNHARTNGGRAPYRISAPLVGLTARAIRNWLYKGKALADQLDDEENDITINDIESARDNDIHYLKFYYDYREAEAQHKSQLEQESLTRALEGSEKIVYREVVVTHPDTGEVLDRLKIEDSRTVTRDGKAARELLAIADPATYAPTDKREVKHTGSGEGGEIEVSHKDEGSLDLRAMLEGAELEDQIAFLKLMDKLKQTSDSELEKQARQQVIDQRPVNEE